MEQNQVEILSLSDCQAYFETTNPDLYQLLAEVLPPSLDCFIKVNYSYGDLVVNNGHLRLSESPFPGLDSHTTAKIKSELSYCAIPLGYVTENTVEAFIEGHGCSAPLNLISAGKMFGLFETLDYIQDIKTPSFWNISAGVRSIFTLAKISNRKKLTHLSKSLGTPLKDNFNQLSSHWQLFSAIAKATQANWQCPILFFGKSFFEHIKQSNRGYLLTAYLYRQGWEQMARFLVDFDLKVLWRNILDKLASKNHAPNPYISHQIKHVLSLAMQRLPGFIPVGHDFTGAPVAYIQNTLNELYQTKHWPTIISAAPTHTLAKTGEVFYSLSYPSLLEGLPTNQKRYTLLHDLRQIQFLMDVTWSDIQADIEALKKIHLTFIHPDSVPADHMFSPESMMAQYPLASASGQLGSETINTSSAFWRGCICIRHRPEQ